MNIGWEDRARSVVRWIARYRAFAVLVVAICVIVALPTSGRGGGSGVSSGTAGAGSAGVRAPAGAASSTGAQDGGTGGIPAPAGAVSSAAGLPSASEVGTGATGGGGTSGGAPPQAATAAPGGAGMDSPAALAAPNCDPATKRVRLPAQYAPPCVVPWPGTADNGGTTSPGVSGKAITVVVILDDTASNQEQASAQAYEQAAAVYAHVDQLWGRKVNLVFFEQGNGSAGGDPDEVQQNALALEAENYHPFAVITIGYPTLEHNLVNHRIVTLANTVGIEDAQAANGYLWATELGASEAGIYTAADYVQKRLLGRPAQWAGDATYRAKTRTFGLIYPDNADPKVFNQYFASKGIHLVDEEPYAVNNLADAAEQWSTITARLHSDGVTTVLDGVDAINNVQLTDQAANQLYDPEWFMLGLNGIDVSTFARLDNQSEWSHAFGVGQVAPQPRDGGWGQKLWNWYYGPGTAWPTSCCGIAGPRGMMGQLSMLFSGIQLAGPELTPQSFAQALFSDPPAGGAACGCVTLEQVSFGRWGGAPPGFTDYHAFDDFTELYWDPNAVGPDEVTGAEGKGMYRYLDGGRRYALGTWPVGPPAAFNPAGTITLNDLATAPSRDRPPQYPCSGCPSGAGG